MIYRNKEVINIADPDNSIAVMLSNFTNTPFTFEGVEFLNGEAFLQAIKFEEIDKQLEIAQLEGHKAKMKGKKRTKALIENPYVYWNGKQYKLHSDDYYELIYKALSAKFYQNTRARTALLLTKDAKLIFDLGYPSPKFDTFPNDKFIVILQIIREDIIENIKEIIRNRNK